MRQGLTPVVAVAILAGMAMVAAGGAYGWVQMVQQESLDTASRNIDTELTVKDIRCTGTTVDLALKNSGGKDITAVNADVYLYRDGDLVDSFRTDVSGEGMLDRGGFSELTLPFTTYMDPARGYTVELDFVGSDYSLERGCTGETGLLEAYWPFDATAGRTVADATGDHDGTYTGFDHNGTISGIRFNGTLGTSGSSESSDPAWSTDCPDGTCLALDGSDDRVTVPASTGLNETFNSEAWTISFMFYPSGGLDGTDWKDFINAPTANNGHFRIELDGGQEDAIAVYWSSDDGTSGDNPSYGLCDFTGLGDTRWYRLTVTLNMSGSGAHCYVDDTETGSKTAGSFGAFEDATGALNVLSGAGTAWRIDDLRIYNVSLDADTVYDLEAGDAPADGIMAYYPMDEGQGQDVWNDAFLAPGKHGTAFRSDGIDDVMVAPIPNPDSITVETWVNLDDWQDAADSGSSHHVYPQGDGFGLTTSGSNWEFWIRDAGGRNMVTEPHTAGDLGEWHHMAVTYNRTTGEMTAYLDGDVVGTNSLGAGTAIDWGSQLLDVSHTNWNTDGKLDDVRLYRRALSQAEVQDDMAGGAPKEGIVARYGFDATGFDAWNTGFQVAGKHGGAARFDGTDTFIGVPHAAGLNMGSGPFTIATWMKHENADNVDHAGIVAKGPDNSLGTCDQAQYVFRHAYNTPREIWFKICDGSNGAETRDNYGTGDGTWHHYVVGRNSSHVFVAVDGTVRAVSSTSGVGSTDNAYDLAIGAQTSGGGGRILNGTLDDLRLYGRALSPDEIGALYEATR